MEKVNKKGRVYEHFTFLSTLHRQEKPFYHTFSTAGAATTTTPSIPL
jgi:hypothetical protein